MNRGNNTVRFTRKRRSVLVIAAALVLVFSLSAVAYATDIGGIRQSVDSWLYGEPVKMDVEQIGEHEFRVTYPDGTVRGTGGIAYDTKGNEIPLTIDDIIDEVNSTPIVEKNDAGRIMLYYRDHIEDITDLLDSRNIAKIEFKDGVLKTYITVKWEGEDGYSVNVGHMGYAEP